MTTNPYDLPEEARVNTAQSEVFNASTHRISSVDLSIEKFEDLIRTGHIIVNEGIAPIATTPLIPESPEVAAHSAKMIKMASKELTDAEIMGLEAREKAKKIYESIGQ